MDIKVIKSAIKELGTIYSAPEMNSMNIYTYIEFEDGQAIKHVAMIGTLEKKLIDAYKANQPVELHLNHTPKAKNAKYSLVAFKDQDGRMYALDIDEPKTLLKISPLVLLAAGIFTIPLMGVGFALMWLAWTFYKSNKATTSLRNHLLSLKADMYVM